MGKDKAGGTGGWWGDQPGGREGQAEPNCSQRKDRDSRVTPWGPTAPALGTRSEGDEPALTSLECDRPLDPNFGRREHFHECQGG